MAKLRLGAVGDVLVNRQRSEAAFEGASTLLRKIDLVFGNCEGVYSDSPQVAPCAGWRVVAPRQCGQHLSRAGFHVMALANNHILDAGHEGLKDTIDLLHAQGISTVGAGCSLAKAQEPAILERDGVKIGFLAFASVYPTGYEARARRPGLAPMRVHSHYFIPESDPYGTVEPGATPEVLTVVYPKDLATLTRLIACLRRQADIVVVSHHWGSARRPAVLADYERNLGRASIDAGADIVLGHHHHFLRAIEIYKGKPIYYGLGHFIFDLPGLDTSLSALELEQLRQMGDHAIYPRAGYPLSPFHPDARMTMVAICDITDGKLSSFGFVPCLINRDNQAWPLVRGTKEWRDFVTYMKAISADAGIAFCHEDADLRDLGASVIQILPETAAHGGEHHDPRQTEIAR